jgi:CheY-like chemotaxis protein
MDGDRILVIDDCRINVLLLKHVLSRLDVKVDSAGTGEEGLALASQQNYPLIFLDIMLPGLDGLEVCRQLRARPLQPRPRIVLLTAMGEQFSQSKVAEVGADGVFFKPIVPSRILEIARETLDRAKEKTAILTKEP